ncbi:MAG TPA: hydroxysqualene dehydroxylase HpnE [Pirellulales bacterium]|nr:hydroxysqualene dehydroxylase HpnE [Pirellulales bacterium]
MSTAATTASERHSTARVLVVGGGLAGMAAAVRLAEAGLAVELFEARRQLGGRAASFYDQASGQWIDHCQHLSMGCCTNLADFCRRTQIADAFRRDRVLHFFAPEGRCYRLAGSRWLPAPLHLTPSFLRLGFLSLRERWAIALALWRLTRTVPGDDDSQPTIGQWLRTQGQSIGAIERFWSVVLVSALGEEVERASLGAARKVFVDGFLSARRAYEVEVPLIPLGELYGRRLEDWLRQLGVTVHLGTAVERVECQARRATAVVTSDGTRREADAVVVAMPWRRVRDVFDAALLDALPGLAEVGQISAAPITGVHLWFNREITALPHAVLVGRLSQWVFNRGRRATDGQAAEQQTGQPAGTGYYYQVVISASRSLAGRDRDEVVREVVGDLAAIWPQAGMAHLIQWRVVSDQAAVFSARPGTERYRPPQRTPIANLALAGDWTRTGWPATMEGAVRSGYLAAEAVLQSLGHEASLLAPDLPRGWLARLLVRSSRDS